MTYRVTRFARDDLDGVLDYGIGRWGLTLAAAFIEEVHLLLPQLANAPWARKYKVIEGHQIFRVNFKTYAIFFTRNEGAEIIAVLHQTRNIAPLLEERLEAP